MWQKLEKDSRYLLEHLNLPYLHFVPPLGVITFKFIWDF